MKRSNLYLVFQFVAGLITSQIVLLTSDPTKGLVALAMVAAIITLTTAAIISGRRSARVEALAESKTPSPTGFPSSSKQHAVITGSMRGCYEMILQVNGTSAYEDLGDDTHLLHGEHFNLLVKRVDGTIVGVDDKGREVHVAVSSDRRDERTMSEDKGGTN